jgi:hypothetical protein
MLIVNIKKETNSLSLVAYNYRKSQQKFVIFVLYFCRFCVLMLPVCEKVILKGTDDSSLRKEKITQLIKNYDASLTFVKPKTSSSPIWSSSSYVSVSNRKQDFVSCDKCKDVLHHKSICGTSSVIKYPQDF